MNEQMSEQEMLRRLKIEETAPETPPDLSVRIWEEISPRLQPYSRPKRTWWRRPRPSHKPVIAFAAGLLVLSFAVGRFWERTQQPKNIAAHSNALARSTAERILLIAAADHLERSDRFLVELRMSPEGSPELARRARQLLNDNRLYQQSAVYANDAAMADVLDRLGRVLAEVAHGEQSKDVMPILVQDDFRLDDLVRAIRAEQQRSPVCA